MNAPTSSPMIEQVIQPRRGWWQLDLAELWQFRELFWELSFRNMIVRYKQTVFGYVWAVVNPLLSAVVMTITFGKLARLPSGDLPYLVLALSGTMAWQLFSNTLIMSGNSLVGNRAMIAKIYFPRLYLPASMWLVGAMNFVIGLVVLLGATFLYGFAPRLEMLLIPVVTMLILMLSVGVGFFFTALHVFYRDVNFILPHIIQLGFFLSPVVYSSSVIPAKWVVLFSLNPMVGLIDLFRWSLYGPACPPNMTSVLISLVATPLLFVGGMFFLKSLEPKFSDYI